MTLRKETIFPIPISRKDQKLQRAAFLVENLAKKMVTGQYIQRLNPIPTFFIKLSAWENNIEISNIDLEEEHILETSNGLKIELEPTHVNGNLEDHDACRFVLLAENGFTSFFLELN